jgi:hypothetical protein
MTNFLLAYRGGVMAPTEEEREATMAAWGQWFGSLGPAVVDGGAPFAGSKSVASSDVSDGAPSQLTGYSVVQADDLAGAVELAKGCPLLTSGGSVDVYESLPM